MPADAMALVLAALARLEDENRQLRADVRRLLERDRGHDTRFPVFVAEVFEFALDKPWPAGELRDDARQARQLILADVIDQITGDCAEPVKSLGRWLQKHDGTVADGYRLERVDKRSGTWRYRVSRE